MQSVLASLQSDTNVEQQLADTLVSWNQAQARIAGLEADNAHLAQRLQQAQQAVRGMRVSSSQEWGGGRHSLGHRGLSFLRGHCLDWACLGRALSCVPLASLL